VVKVKMSNGEQKDAEWWLMYWKRTAAWLVTRLEQTMDGEDVSGTIDATLPVIKRELGGEHGHR